MTLRDKIAERLRDFLWPEAADLFDAGDFDDIFGVPEPTLEDVREEARRVYGEDAGVVEMYVGVVGYAHVATTHGGSLSDHKGVRVPTLASTYQALRAMPTKGET